MLKNLLSSWVTGKNHIALNPIMNTINAESEGWSEFALVVLMAPKRDVSVQVQVCEVCYLPTAVCPALALNLFFCPAAVCPASALVIVLSRSSPPCKNRSLCLVLDLITSDVFIGQNRELASLVPSYGNTT